MHVKMQSALPLLDRIETCYHAGERYGEPCYLPKAATGHDLAGSSRAEN